MVEHLASETNRRIFNSMELTLMLASVVIMDLQLLGFETVDGLDG